MAWLQKILKKSKNIPLSVLVITFSLSSILFYKVYHYKNPPMEIIESEEIAQNPKELFDISEELIAYSLKLRRATDHLRNAHLCKDTEISVEHTNQYQYKNNNAPKNKRCHLFHPDGGKQTSQDKFGGKTLQSPALFSADFQILDMREPNLKKPYNTHKDLAMYINVNKETCSQANKRLGMDADKFAVERDLPKTPFKGSYKSSNSYAGPNNGETLEGAMDNFREVADQMGCWKVKNSEKYLFFITLIRRG